MPGVGRKSIKDDVGSIFGDMPQPGRPVRKSAGRREIDPNYVNSTETINDAIGDLVEENKAIYPKQKKAIKRKRARSPSPPPLSPVEFPSNQQLKAQEDPIDLTIAMPSEAPCHITVNVPLGFQGPIHLSIDATLLQRLSTPPSTRQQTPFIQAPPPKRQRFGKIVERFVAKHGQPRGFCHLPPGMLR
jgi:hypothetical protein